MGIRLEVKPYCDSCLDFDADVTKPEKTTLYCDGSDPVLTIQLDTVVRCKYAKRCEAIKRYLEKQKEDKA